jgi:hypothetical protein
MLLEGSFAHAHSKIVTRCASRSGYGSSGLIEPGSNPDPKHCIMRVPGVLGAAGEAEPVLGSHGGQLQHRYAHTLHSLLLLRLPCHRKDQFDSHCYWYNDWNYNYPNLSTSSRFPKLTPSPIEKM